MIFSVLFEWNFIYNKFIIKEGKKKLNYSTCYLESQKERITEPNVEYKTCFVLSKIKIIFPKFFFFN